MNQKYWEAYLLFYFKILYRVIKMMFFQVQGINREFFYLRNQIPTSIVLPLYHCFSNFLFSFFLFLVTIPLERLRLFLSFYSVIIPGMAQGIIFGARDWTEVGARQMPYLLRYFSSFSIRFLYQIAMMKTMLGSNHHMF